MSNEEGAGRGLGASGVDPEDPADVAEQVAAAGVAATRLDEEVDGTGSSSQDTTLVLESAGESHEIATVPGSLVEMFEFEEVDTEVTLGAAVRGAAAVRRATTAERFGDAGAEAVNLARTVEYVTGGEFTVDLPVPAAPDISDERSVSERLAVAKDRGADLDEVVEHTTVSVNPELDEDRFFSTKSGTTTITNRYDMEKAVPDTKKRHFREVERYWVNEPFAFVIIFHSQKENEKKYYVVEPHLNDIEENLVEFLSGKLRMAIKYSDDEVQMEGDIEERRAVIRNEARKLLERYGLYDGPDGSEDTGLVEDMLGLADTDEAAEDREVGGVPARPEPAVLADDPRSLDDYQVEKVLYQLTRNFIGYAKIDGIKNDINVEDISCDGYNSRVFVYHTNYENIITNIEHGHETLDDFVVKLAQRSGKGISKRQPQVDATLPDGSRAQLTLGHDVSDHGTNYTIRQFKDIPFTPVDLINWNTFSLDEMAFLWLCIENNKSLLFAGGTASGKTTSLNAVSLFIPSNTKIVSIEDTREVKLPQRNWVASVTRPSFAEEGTGDINEFDLLEAALRQRPEYIVFGEVRGEEGRYLFQVMSTGHTTYTTFHADSVAEVLRRFTTDPINVSKTMFTALDLVSIQTQTRVEGHKVRRNRNITEINHYDAENDEINVQDVFQWQAETDEYLKMGASNTLQELRFDRGWTQQEIDDEMFKRKVVLAYLINNGLNNYSQVAATIQAFINDDETTLALLANNRLEESLDDLREMESVDIGVDAQAEAIFPRPDPGEELRQETQGLLDEAEERLFEEFAGLAGDDLSAIIEGMEDAKAADVTVEADGDGEAETVSTDGGIPEGEAE